MFLREDAISLAERLGDPLGLIEGVPGGQINPTPSLFITQSDEGVWRLNLGRGGEGGRKMTPHYLKHF